MANKHFNLPGRYIAEINRRAEADSLARDYMDSDGSPVKLQALIDFFNVRILPRDAAEREWYNYMRPIVDAMLSMQRRTTEIVVDLQSPTGHRPEHVTRKQDAILSLMRKPGPLDAYVLIAGKVELMYLLRMSRAEYIPHYDGTKYVAVRNAGDYLPKAVRSRPVMRAESEDSSTRYRRGMNALHVPAPPRALSRVAAAMPGEAPAPTPEELAQWSSSVEEPVDPWSSDSIDDYLPENNK